jgi:hypothetical protein
MQAVRFQIQFFQALLFHNIKKRDLRGTRDGTLTQNVLNPAYVFTEYCLSHSGESHPDASFVHRQQSSAPSWRLTAISDVLYLSKVNDLLSLQIPAVHDYDPSVHRGK